MRKKITAGNWKMNLQYGGAKALLKEIIQSRENFGTSCELVICPPALYLSVFCELLKDHEWIHVGAQNCFYEDEGAFTGEISPAQLQSLTIKYCIVGHSERRNLFNETYADLAKKVKALLRHNITPIFCCGEQLKVRESNVHKEFVLNQIESSLFQLSAEEIENVILAYEPIWAIGTGQTATAEQAQEMHNLIRTRITSQFGQKTGSAVSILYGGSVKPENARELFAQPDIDGGLIGGASLDAASFAAISNSF
jgi:triosephosphate isomerase